MSLFLGKIHFWLYNKIQWFESLEAELIDKAKEKDSSIVELAERINDKYGAPAGNKPLEEIIDTNNIHGWLQQKIENAESRQAALITGILERNPAFRTDLFEIFTRQGKAAAYDYNRVLKNPEEIFNALNDFILEGMPCDRVNEVIESNKNEFSWRTTMCLHKPYWNRAGGDVRNFYELREAWVKAFVETINPDFKYEKTEDGLNRIFRQG